MAFLSAVYALCQQLLLPAVPPTNQNSRLLLLLPIINFYLHPKEKKILYLKKMKKLVSESQADERDRLKVDILI